LLEALTGPWFSRRPAKCSQLSIYGRKKCLILVLLVSRSNDNAFLSRE
jgi:hypothetical protein